MDLYGVLKSIFGFHKHNPTQDFTSLEDFHNTYESESEKPMDNSFFDDFMGSSMDFHRIFQEQVESMMREFSTFSGFNNFFSDHPGSLPLEDHSNSSLREQFLKPGFDSPSTSKADTDLDGQVNINDLDTVLKSEEQKPSSLYPNAQTKCYGQSVSSRTIVKPDGSIETTQIRRGTDGFEEKIVTHKDRNSEYTFKTYFNKHGEKIKEEKILNQAQNTDLLLPSKHKSWLDFF